jgi:hypothetical protein
MLILPTKKFQAPHPCSFVDAHTLNDAYCTKLSRVKDSSQSGRSMKRLVGLPRDPVRDLLDTSREKYALALGIGAICERCHDELQFNFKSV